MRFIESIVIAIAAVDVMPACVLAHHPAVSVTAFAPIVVQGEGFAPGERVGVHVSVGGAEYSREVEVPRAGAFKVTLPHAIARDRCNTTVWASATTEDGTIVRAKLPEPQCPLLP